MPRNRCKGPSTSPSPEFPHLEKQDDNCYSLGGNEAEVRSCSQECPGWGLAPSIAPSSSLDTSQRPQAPLLQNGHPPGASEVAPGALWNGIKVQGSAGELWVLLSQYPPSWESLWQVPTTSLDLDTSCSIEPGSLLLRLLPSPTRDLNTQRLLGEPLPQRWLTLEMERGTLKSLPPCSRKPQGAGPSSTTLKDSMVPAPGRKEKVSGQHSGCARRPSSGHQPWTGARAGRHEQPLNTARAPVGGHLVRCGWVSG